VIPTFLFQHTTQFLGSANQFYSSNWAAPISTFSHLGFVTLVLGDKPRCTIPFTDVFSLDDLIKWLNNSLFLAFSWVYDVYFAFLIAGLFACFFYHLISYFGTLQWYQSVGLGSVVGIFSYERRGLAEYYIQEA